MTQKEAYIDGFRKTAEAYGVDPEQLVKVAKRLGGPDPAPGMLGASQSAPKEGFFERLFNKMPTGAISFTRGKGGFHMVTHGDMKKLTEGMTPLQRALAYMNPMTLNFSKAAEAHGVDPRELMKTAKKDTTITRDAIIGGAVGASLPLASIPLDLIQQQSQYRQSKESLKSLGGVFKTMAQNDLSRQNAALRKFMLKIRAKQALMLGLPLAAVGGFLGSTNGKKLKDKVKGLF